MISTDRLKHVYELPVTSSVVSTCIVVIGSFPKSGDNQQRGTLCIHETNTGLIKVSCGTPHANKIHWDTKSRPQIDGFVEAYSNSGALVIELLQSCTKPSK